MKRITSIEKVGSDYKIFIESKFDMFKESNEYWCDTIYVDGDILFNLFNSLNVDRLSAKKDGVSDE